MATLCCLSTPSIASFCLAMVSIKLFAAPFSASIRLVRSPPPIGSSIEPEASNTITMSSGVVTVTVELDVEDIAESVVTKSDALFSPVSLTVLSVQIRPTFWVVTLLPPWPAAQISQRPLVSGSMTFPAISGPSIPVLDLALASGSMANAAAGNTSTTASITAKRPLVYLLIASPFSRAQTLHQPKVTK